MTSPAAPLRAWPYWLTLTFMPLVVFAADPGVLFLLFPVLSGAIALVAIAALFHRYSGHDYPQGPN